MSICSHRSRSIILRRHWSRSVKEASKRVIELEYQQPSSQNYHGSLINSIRSVGTSGSSTPPNSSSKGTKTPADKKEDSTKIKSNQFLQNYQPYSEQTEKILHLLKTTSRQLTDKATQIYNEKKDIFNKKSLSADGEEEHWYAARVNIFMKQYEDYIGLTDVKNAQVRVQKTEKLFVTSQDDRRETQRLINEVDGKIKNIRTELERTYRGDDKYLELVTEEHAVLKEEHMLKEQLSIREREEREAFSKLSRAVRDSHESERAQAEKTKYWAILGSIIGTSLGILGTTINNRLRMRELRQIVRDAASGHTQATAGAAALATTLAQDNTSGSNDSSTLNTAAITEVKDKLENVSKQVLDAEKLTSDKVNDVSNSISLLFETLDQHQRKLSEAISRSDRGPGITPSQESINKKAFLEMQKSLETQIMRWEEKMDDIIKAHLENSNNSRALLLLEKRLSEVLALEKEIIKETSRSYEDHNRNRAIGTYLFNLLHIQTLKTLE